MHQQSLSRKQTLLAFVTLLLVSVGILLFIKTNNDHLECEQVIEHKTDPDGNKVTERRHVCKERFNF